MLTSALRAVFRNSVLRVPIAWFLVFLSSQYFEGLFSLVNGALVNDFPFGSRRSSFKFHRARICAHCVNVTRICMRHNHARRRRTGCRLHPLCGRSGSNREGWLRRNYSTIYWLPAYRPHTRAARAGNTGLGHRQGRRLCALRNGSQNVTGPGYIGEIYLGPDLVFGGSRTDPLGACRSRGYLFSLKIGAHFIRFIRIERTGMGFLLEDTSQGQRIKDGLALDLQLSGQVVDSHLRLVHPSSRYRQVLAVCHQTGRVPGALFRPAKPVSRRGAAEMAPCKV
jgi:hypothetical protein